MAIEGFSPNAAFRREKRIEEKFERLHSYLAILRWSLFESEEAAQRECVTGNPGFCTRKNQRIKSEIERVYRELYP